MSPKQRKALKELKEARWCAHGSMSPKTCPTCTPSVEKQIKQSIRLSKLKKQKELDEIIARGGSTQEVNCWKKVQFHNRSRAIARAAQIKEHGNIDLYPYWCPVCGFWHLTSQIHG